MNNKQFAKHITEGLVEYKTVDSLDALAAGIPNRGFDVLRWAKAGYLKVDEEMLAALREEHFKPK